MEDKARYGVYLCYQWGAPQLTVIQYGNTGGQDDSYGVSSILPATSISLLTST